MSQKNYFAYNIIDTLYFNKPTGQDLVNKYGLDYIRKTDSEYERLTDTQKAIYDTKEREFIQAVINKYIMDDFGNGSYFDVGPIGNTANTYVTAYFKDKSEIGIELGDMISTINGTHNYKLMSAKDIDFDNVILPNSKIDNEFNWGEFDKNRRWGNKPVTINNTFELLNVIDYLLCACNNLWDELYKIKYNSNEYVQIWFTKDATNSAEIRFTNRLQEKNMRLNSNPSDYITYLDPCNYYTFVNNKNNNDDNKFGVVTNFHLIDGENPEDFFFTRKITDAGNRNIIMLDISIPNKSFAENFNVKDIQNINGNLQEIFGYKIGTELRIYPGARVNAFINSGNQYYNPDSLIDFKNKKLNKEVYFRISGEPGNDIYSKVYIKFLDTKKVLENLPQNKANLENPYFLYYIGNDKKNHILTCNFQNSSQQSLSKDEDLINLIKNKVSQDQLHHPNDYCYIFDIYDDVDSYNAFQFDKLNGLPLFYAIPNEFYSTLEVSTPNSALYSASSDSIVVYYYKNHNSLNCSVTRKENDNTIDILAEYDRTQKDSLAYHDYRYNIPSDETVYFKFDATYVALNSTCYPSNLKIDDEYEDILYYYGDNVENDIPGNNNDNTSYYRLNMGVDINYKRNFERFKKSNFVHNSEYNLAVTNGIDIENYRHVWMKQENPYKINVRLESDEFIVQQATQQEVNDEINNIIANNDLIQTTYNEYQFKHTLPENIEQIKMNMVFTIDATSRVNEVSYTIPVNINKIFRPTINYISKIALEKERENYNSIEFNIDNRDETITVSKMYDYMYNKYNSSDKTKLNNVYDIYSCISDDPIKSLDDFSYKRTYDNTYSNTIFEFAYHPKYNYVDLIGSWYTNMAIKGLPNNVSNNGVQVSGHGFANAWIIKTDDNNIKTVSYLKNNINDPTPYIFNINGFGFNYRLHGGNGVVNQYFSNSNPNINDPRFNRYYNQYDLLSIATPSKYSINKELEIKLTDDPTTLHQLSYMSMNSTNNWNKNEFEFYSGINIDEDNTYMISTVPLNIYKQSYLVKCETVFMGNPEELEYNAISYYIPMAYMEIKSSTLCPPLTYNPTSYVHNLNEPEDIEKYKNYVKWWDSQEDKDEFYKPITMSLKLTKNINEANPFYYDSNEAVMKFNIRRSSPGTGGIIVSGKEKIIYVALNSRYYMSDFVNVGNTTNNPNTVVTIPTGSYMYYDPVCHMHTVNEIYNNGWKTLKYPNSDLEYNYYTYSNVEGISIPGTTINNYQIPYPIFKQSSMNYDTMIFDEDKYDYNIYRISDINKLKLNSTKPIEAQVFASPTDEQAIQSNEQPLNAVGVTTNKDLFYVDFTNEFKNNFGVNSQNFNVINYVINPVSILGSKNYTGLTLTTTGSQTKIAPIIRQRPSYGASLPSIISEHYSDYISQLESIYEHNVEYDDKNYEFFEFKYTGIYNVTIRIDSINNQIYVNKESLAPNENLGLQEAFDRQLIAFINGVYYNGGNNEYSFICTENVYNNTLRNLENNGI